MADPRPYPGTPHWVRIVGIIVLALVLLAGIVLFTGLGGPHGPRRHGPSHGPDGHMPPSPSQTNLAR